MFRNSQIHKKIMAEKNERPWVGKMQPFEIINGVYYVGTYQACCYLIDTGDGLIMIDPGYNNTAYLVVNSIYKLGFKPEDIKYIICSHWHGDHAEAVNSFKDLSGAKTVIGRFDFEKAKKYFDADITLADGDTLSLGNITIKFMETPGHTKGTLSFFFDVVEDGKTYRVGQFGGAGANTLVKEYYDFDGAVEAYYNSLARLKEQKVDVFIGNHCWNNGTYEKMQKKLKSNDNPFVDDKIWGEFLDFCKTRLDEIVKEGK